MAWQLRVLAALQSTWHQFPVSTLWVIITYSSNSWQTNALFWPPWVLQACNTNMPEKRSVQK